MVARTRLSVTLYVTLSVFLVTLSTIHCLQDFSKLESTRTPDYEHKRVHRPNLAVRRQTHKGGHELNHQPSLLLGYT
jgi:hypothetical protein